ncbi:MAG: DUF3857 domain-containing protein [Bacteroidota bacterium]
MKNSILLFLLLLITVKISAQEPFYKSYSWDEKADYKSYNLDPASEKDIISLKDKIVTEFYFNDDDNLVEFYLEHNAYWLNSDEKIEEFNKIYLPYNSGSELLTSKARVINKEGKVIELDDSKILTAQNEETKEEYKYYAIEGIEKGSVIEYYFIVKKFPSYRGKRMTFQESYEKRNIEFDLFSPSNLIFDFKSYNGLQDIEQDTLSEDKLHWKLSVDKIEELENEERSPYDASKQYLVYKLDQNKYSNVHGISSYDNVSENLYKLLFQELSKSEASNVKKLIKNAGAKKKEDASSSIRALENYIKSNFYFSEINSEESKDISSVIKSKTGSEIGLLKVYIAALNSIGIPTEVVLTSNRFNLRFDDDYEAYNFLTDYLLYFPTVDKYTSIKELESRMGFPPIQFTDNYGLFIKEVAVGNYKSGVGQIKYITAPSAEDSEDNMTIDISFDTDKEMQSIIKLEREFKGYNAVFIQPFVNLIDKEAIDGLYDEIIKSISESITIKNKEVKNDKSELFGVKPFIIIADIESDAFVNKAGRKYLFKLGELIGPQMEMYQEDERVLPLEGEFNKTYNRVININIPEGYKISNIDDINIHHYYEKSKEERLFEFHSYYELKENILTVHANEYYRENKVEPKVFEDYRKVINGAADFNKIVLILEPEEKI